MDKKQIVAHLEDTIDVCEFLIEELEYTPEGSGVHELIEESKQLIQQLT
tara:strand:+ start:584 stop:730 length:147 start_codon:yes stop_codon:yes gene_type:complete